MTATVAARDRAPYAALFSERRDGEPAFWRERRAEAFERFERLGFPTPRDEAWRHTNVAPIADTTFAPAPAVGEVPVEIDSIGNVRAVVANGRLVSVAGSVPDGITLRSLVAAAADGAPEIEAHLGRVAIDDGHPLTALNTALAADGLWLSIAPGAVVDEPLEIVYVTTESGSLMTTPRALIVAGRGSQATVVETYVGPDAAYWTNAVTEVVVEDGARLDHYKEQREGSGAFHTTTLEARLGRDAWFSDRAFSFGARIARNEVNARFTEPGAEAELHGLFMPRGRQLSDTHTRIDHAAPQCVSRELYQGVLDDEARGVLHATVVVRPHAQKTDADQQSRNLLLSRDALVNATPALEIFADDVKCRHGATTGQLDAASLFYLRSRGLDESQSRSILTYAFAAAVVEPVRIAALRDRLRRQLAARHPGAAEVIA